LRAARRRSLPGRDRNTRAVVCITLPLW
jgi:hypothetical protein